MEWTKNKPKEPGFYLLYNPGLNAIYCHNIFLSGSELVMLDLNSTLQNIEIIENYLWYGPIQQPEESNASRI